MPMLKISTAKVYDLSTIEKAQKTIAQRISSSYGCDLKHVWINWDNRAESVWYYREKSHRAEEFGFVSFEYSCFSEKSNTNVGDVLILISETLKESLRDVEVFGTFQELKRNQVVYNNKLLEDGI